MMRKGNLLWFLAGLLLAGFAGIFHKEVLMGLVCVAAPLFLFVWWKERQNRGFAPKSKRFKALKKMQEKHEKRAQVKHHHINDQIRYIESEWGYTKEQKRIMDRFLEQRAYTAMYNRLSASLLPQLITLIDQCNVRGQKGCKREVSRRIREMTLLMKNELKRQKFQSTESFETTLEVYDRLLRESK